jgi:ferredoxin-type protein NapG
LSENRPKIERKEPLSDRRKFILTMARGVGVTALGGFVWSAFIDEVTASQLILRPPGAIKEDDFLKNVYQVWAMC